MISRHLPGNKSLLRLHAQSLRKEAHAKRPDAGVHAAAHFMRALAPAPDLIIAVYYPAGTELDTWPLAEALFENLNTVCLPVVLAKNTPLVFRRYTLETVLTPGRFGIDVPPEEEPELIPDIIVTPLLAFRRDGARLGMGGGFYDRTLKMLRATEDIPVVGYAYGVQEVPELTPEAHDEPLDWIVTEREAIRV